MFDLNIITCVATSSRLSKLLLSLQPLLHNSLLDKVFLFCKYDQDYLNLQTDSSLWPRHIQEIYPILSRNIKAVNPTSLPIRQLLDLHPDILFPPRALSTAEVSLLCKHRSSLANVAKPTLVLEDDAIIDTQMIDYLLCLFEYCCQRDLFLDLGTMNGLSAVGTRIQISHKYSAFISRIGLTRTTGAFYVTPFVAAQLLQYYEPVSLPADLHHQYLICKQGIPGIWPDCAIFNNISGSADCPSSIQSQNV